VRRQRSLSGQPRLKKHCARIFDEPAPPNVGTVRSIDLALYADELAARAATLAAQLERARCRLRQEALEREARRALDEGAVARLEALGLLGRTEARALRAEIRELQASLAAVESLQTWVEKRLAAADELARIH
jgi:hypothetical protein